MNKALIIMHVNRVPFDIYLLAVLNTMVLEKKDKGKKKGYLYSVMELNGREQR